MMRKVSLSLFLLFFMLFPLFAEESSEDLMDEDMNLDALFEEESDFQDLSEEETKEVARQAVPQEQSGVSSTDKEIDLLNDVIKKSSYSLLANFRFVGGYSSGWNYMPWNPGINDSSGLDSMALMDMKSSVGLNFQIGPEFRVLQKYSLSFPELETEVTEFFCDFNVKNSLYVRMGRQTVTWGISRNFPFTNLTARVPDDFGDRTNDPYLDKADSYALKLNLPLGIGGVEGLVFTRNGFFEDPLQPSADEIGYGGNVNLATKNFDLTMGTFYHAQMNLRGFYSLSSTIFKNVEIYQEGLISYDIQGDDIQPDRENRFTAIDAYYQYPVTRDDYDYESTLSDVWDFSLNLGFYMDFFDKKLKLSGEYFYCGEETELDVKNTQFPLLWGHNLAGMVSYKTGKNKLNLFTQLKYNPSENSGLVIPGITWDAVPYLTINMATPIVWGSLDGGYNQHNPDRKDRPVSFIITAVLSGKI